MILGQRQAKYGCAQLPPIPFNNKPNIDGFETFASAFSTALWKRMSHNLHWDKEFLEKPHIAEAIENEKKRFIICVEQTISFLKSIDAIKPVGIIHAIKLWKEGYQMPPFYEGINGQLGSTMLKKLCPDTYKEMDKGAVYASANVSNITESVLYVMEYFQKEKLLNKVDDVIEHPIIQKLFCDWAEYTIKNKDKIEAQNKAREEYEKKRMKEHKKIMDGFKKLKNKIEK